MRQIREGPFRATKRREPVPSTPIALRQERGIHPRFFVPILLAALLLMLQALPGFA